MAIIIIIVILFISLLVAIWLIKQWLFTKNIVKNFKKKNVIVFGKKGTGKDLIFQKVINKRKEYYYANIPYGGKYTNVTVKDLSLSPNTYIDFINNKVTPVERKFFEGEDYYLSDGGIILPSQYDSTLDKLFPSFCIFYALSRHNYNSNVHINSQCLERVWKKLREQADFFVKTKKTIKLPFFLFTKCVTYDKYQSAAQELEPVKTRLLNKYSKAEVDIYQATNGEIKTGWVIQRKRKVKYDTRAFEKVCLLGERKTRDKEQDQL